MQWLVTNWFWMLVGIAFVAMHVFGHGGHGGHGGSDRPRRGDAADTEDAPGRRVERGAGSHQH